MSIITWSKTFLSTNFYTALNKEVKVNL